MLPSMRALAVLLVAAACQSGSSSPADRGAAPGIAPAGPSAGPSVLATLTRPEADSLCHAFERSGAAADVEANHGYLIANWLAKEIVSDTGRAWLANFARLGQDKPARRAALTQVARDTGLADCPLVAMWGD